MVEDNVKNDEVWLSERCLDAEGGLHNGLLQNRGSDSEQSFLMGTVRKPLLTHAFFGAQASA
jgi:hypothetical protein